MERKVKFHTIGLGRIPFFLAFPALIFFLTIACQSEPAGSKEIHRSSGNLVDCNYFWPLRKRHVCIKDMPVQECEMLFSDARMGFQREEVCYCDEKGRQKNQITGTGYVQYDCQ